jgi:phosphatidylglycerol:prolipoprotein diacylglycerol transferase
MFIHNLNPNLFSIGPFTVKYYGLVYAIGFVLSYLILQHFAKHNKIKNLTIGLVDKFTIYLILATIVGARLGEVLFYNLSYYFHNPLNIFALWQGGMSFHGALIGIVLVLYFFCKKYKLNFLEIADIISIPAAFTLFLGRIANFINAELIGKISNSWFCIDYSNYGVEGCRYPSQIYEALKNVFIGFFLIFQRSYLIKKKNKKHGFVFFTFITLYGLLRFLVTFYREDPAIFLGLGTGQLFSLAMFVLGAILLINLKRKK